MTRRRSKRQGQSDKGKPRQRVSTSDAERIMAQTILNLLKIQRQVCADDLHLHLDIPPDCMKFVAHVFRGLQKRGLIHIVAIKNTPREDQRGNRIAIWEPVPNNDMGSGMAAVPRPNCPRGDRTIINGAVSK